jgi:proteasome lid subunit RPN8/RPN11
MSEPVRIPRNVWDQITNSARVGLYHPAGPREACGYLLGPAGAEHPDSSIELPNVSEYPGQRFAFDDATWLRHCQWMDEARLKPMIIWHSHPGYGPEPSEHDIRNAVDPNLSHLIISMPVPGMRVANGVPHGKLWKLDPTVRPGSQAVERPMVVW